MMEEVNLPVIDLNGEPKKSSKLFQEFIEFDGAKYCIGVMFYAGTGFSDMHGKQILVNIDRVEPDLKPIGTIDFPLERELK